MVTKHFPSGCQDRRSHFHKNHKHNQLSGVLVKVNNSMLFTVICVNPVVYYLTGCSFVALSLKIAVLYNAKIYLDICKLNLMI